MDIVEKDVKRAVDLAIGYNRASDSEMILAGMILMAQAIEEHRTTVGRLADAMVQIANNFGVIGCHISDIRRELGKAVEIYKHSE